MWSGWGTQNYRGRARQGRIHPSDCPLEDRLNVLIENTLLDAKNGYNRSYDIVYLIDKTVENVLSVALKFELQQVRAT